MFYNLVKYSAMLLIGCGLLLAAVSFYLGTQAAHKLLLPLSMICLGLGTGSMDF